ncbi:uncharacterized protein LOC126744437 [Anthonomus grandis grandis]|uniref:uncharacterized protein LOC126744437 n=1 Tax=Anthonomus grandis grandis TaxID=2921223 RepID=UPI002165CE06|nr:uncharacterized protein LOC126744437 [Anthonomus grandis grandis]
MDARSSDITSIKSGLIETNNNEVSSAYGDQVTDNSRKNSESSKNSSRIIGTNDVIPNKFEKQLSLQDLFANRSKSENKASLQRKRSNSDGGISSQPENAEAFPSLPNSVLQKLGLYGDVNRERLKNEETLEQKFTSLSLAFTIDATTIKNRCERQRRARDQTESNLNVEVEKLKKNLGLLKPLCINFETADLLSTLYSQIETLTKAASLVSIAAERYGAVQHEDRLTDSVNLMVNYVQALKQQRDTARRQVQYTKKVLQEPIHPVTLSPTNSQRGFLGINKKFIGKRRASTDSVNFNNIHPVQTETNFKLNRRTSDISFRASLLKGRPSRLELGMELNKIKENTIVENIKEAPIDNLPETLQIETEVTKEEVDINSDSDLELNGDIPRIQNTVPSSNTVIITLSSEIRLKFSSLIEDLHTLLVEFFKRWSQKGYMHMFLNSCAVLCFFVSILTLVNTLLEYKTGILKLSN